MHTLSFYFKLVTCEKQQQRSMQFLDKILRTVQYEITETTYHTYINVHRSVIDRDAVKHFFVAHFCNPDRLHP